MATATVDVAKVHYSKIFKSSLTRTQVFKGGRDLREAELKLKDPDTGDRIGTLIVNFVCVDALAFYLRHKPKR